MAIAWWEMPKGGGIPRVMTAGEPVPEKTIDFFVITLQRW